MFSTTILHTERHKQVRCGNRMLHSASSRRRIMAGLRNHFRLNQRSIPVPTQTRQ